MRITVNVDTDDVREKLAETRMPARRVPMPVSDAKTNATLALLKKRIDRQPMPAGGG